MPLSDEQFGNLMKTLESRDLIIRIDENTKNMRANFDDHKKEDAAAQALVTQSLSKIHTRIDGVSDDMKAIRNRIIGGFFVATILASGITWVMNLYNQSRMYQEAMSVVSGGKKINENSIHNT